MTVSQLLAAIRHPYASTFAGAIADSDVYVEPAYRRADGSLATDGALDLPCRADLIPLDCEHEISVDSQLQTEFDPLSFGLGDTAVSIQPFVWNGVTVEIDASDDSPVPQTLRAWFLDWFDADDTNVPSEDCLFGVVHFMSDPVRTEQGWTVSVDLGSVPEQALEDLMFRLSAVGAEQIRVG